jgi:hypothetical protein
MQAAIKHQHQCHGVLRDGIGRVGGNSDNAQSVLHTGIQVNVIEAGTTERDQLDALSRQAADDRRIARVVHENAYYPASCGCRHRVLVQ